MNEDKLRQLARSFAERTPTQRKLFLERLAEHDIDFSLIPIVPRNVNGADKDLLPASYAQARLWYLWSLNPVSPLYTMAGRLALRGILNEDALSKSMNAIVARHEALRTTFEMSAAGEVLQRIHPPALLSIRRLDLKGATEQEIRQAADQEALEPFNLGTGPLLRVMLIHQSAQQHLLLLTVHHIVSDGWSAALMLDELAQGYHSACIGTELMLPPLAIQYPDFSQWQRHWLEAGESERQLSWWRKFLGVDHPQLELPVRYNSSTGTPHTAARHEFTVPPELHAHARHLAQQQGVTLFMLLLASFNVLLYRYTGQTDIRLGIPAAGRQRAESATLIGLFINPLVLRTCLNGEMSFSSLLTEVKNALLDIESHQDVPFEQLVEALGITRQAEQHPLFHVMVNHQVTRPPALWPGLLVEDVSVGSPLAKFDLTLSTEERADGSLRGSWVYSSVLFSKATIAQLNIHFFALFKQCVESPYLLLAQLSLLTHEEHMEIARWNANAIVVRSAFIPIHQRITEQGLGRAKEAVLLHSSGSLSWADLEESSNCLAHQLVVSGVGAEIRVGVHVSRSPRMIIAMLAVLKAGGAFVPLDPDYPSARLVYMLRDAGVSHLLTERGLASGLLDIESLSVVYLEDIDKGYPSTAPGVIIHPEQSAYIIYTSGSTGHPKGVTVGHEALAAHCKAIGLCYELSSADRVLHFASINFDLAHEYWLMPLSYGASLLITDRSLWGAQEMCEQLVDYGVTVAAFPPSYLLQLTQVVQERTMKLPLRVLAFGGEALSSSHFKHVRAAFSPATLINGYGPTETVISPMLWITTPKSESSSWQGGPYLPIGTVVGARTAYVLDAWLNPLPVGVAGELYLGGALLARGYHERAGLTAERFIPDPWGVGGRLYRTGDRACWRSDGSVAYLGRVDKQVKLRGQRIELGEIEAQLLACGGVREAVVVLQGEGAQARLVAYVVADCSPFDFLEVQQQLAQRLPAVMLPTQWVELSRLPVNGSGKLDRHALPLPMPQGDSRPYRAPQSATELSLAAIWAEVLRVERVGLDDHFFMLGGHSLSVMQVCARIQKQMGLMVPLRTLFYAPLFSVFAQHVAGECSNISTVEPALIPHHDPEHAIPLSFAQQSLWFLWQLAPYDPGYTIFTSLRCHGKLDSSILQRCIDALITRHTSLRTTFSINAQGQLQQNIDAPTSVLIREDDFSHRPLTARLVVAQRVAEEESQRPFDLKHGPLIRLRLLHLSSEDHVMLLSIHHIAADGWSMGIIFKELMAIYRAELMGSTVDSTLELPALSISYADYASWQQRSGIEQTGSLTYWRTQLSDLPQLPLPPAQTSFGRTPSLRGKQLLFSLDPVLLENARAFTQQQGVTLAMLLQTIFHAALYQYTGQTDQCIGTLLSNREQLATESLVGLFLNALPLRVHIDPRQSLIGLLNKVKDTVLGAQTHADVPFIQLVEILRPPRSAGRNPLFQVLYNFLPPNSSVLTLPELQIDDFSVPRNTLVFDLELDLAEDAQGQVRGALSYAIERVDAAFAHALWEDYPHLLAALLNAPQAPLVTLIQAVAPVTMTVTKPQEIIPHHAVLEAQLAAIFVETLGLSTTLTRDDNFFALGMRSLDCFVVVENARQQGITLCINDLFLYQTPAELAAALAVSSVALTSPI